jgi:hypothetical protein
MSESAPFCTLRMLKYGYIMQGKRSSISENKKKEKRIFHKK